jgi:phosphonate transport system substrate-binding protein
MLRRPLHFATYLASNVRPVYEYVALHIGKKLGCATKLTDGDCYDRVAEADVTFLCGLPYVQLMKQPEPPIELLAAPVLRGARYGGRPVYFSDVIVRRDSRFRTFADLRGACWAYNEPNSHSGYGIVRYHLAQLGARKRYFGMVIRSGWHERSIQWVALGKVDASAIDSQVLAVALRDHPQLDLRLRVIDTLGPSTIQPVVAARRLPQSLRVQLRALLVDMHHSLSARAALAHGYVERFVPINDADYDDIRAMRAASETSSNATIR